MQGSFWWWQCSDRYIISFFLHLDTPSPPPPSLISLVVSADVKHHVYYLKSNMADLRRCVKVEVAVLGSPSLVSLMVSGNIKQHWNQENKQQYAGLAYSGESSRVTFLCCLILLSIPAVACRRSPSFCQKYWWRVTAKQICTLGERKMNGWGGEGGLWSLKKKCE